MQKILVQLGTTPGGSGVQSIVLLQTVHGISRYNKTFSDDSLTSLVAVANGDIRNINLYHAGTTQTTVSIYQDSPAGELKLYQSTIAPGEVVQWDTILGFSTISTNGIQKGGSTVGAGVVGNYIQSSDAGSYNILFATDNIYNSRNITNNNQIQVISEKLLINAQYFILHNLGASNSFIISRSSAGGPVTVYETVLGTGETLWWGVETGYVSSTVLGEHKYDISGSFTPTAHASTHQAGGADAIKLDNLAAPDDNTDLDASASAHGLLRKLSDVPTQFLDGEGNWSVPDGSGVEDPAMLEFQRAKLQPFKELTFDGIAVDTIQFYADAGLLDYRYLQTFNYTLGKLTSILMVRQSDMAEFTKTLVYTGDLLTSVEHT